MISHKFGLWYPINLVYDISTHTHNHTRCPLLVVDGVITPFPWVISPYRSYFTPDMAGFWTHLASQVSQFLPLFPQPRDRSSTTCASRLIGRHPEYSTIPPSPMQAHGGMIRYFDRPMALMGISWATKRTQKLLSIESWLFNKDSCWDIRNPITKGSTV